MSRTSKFIMRCLPITTPATIFWRCQAPMSRYLVRFGRLFNFSTVSKRYQNQLDSHVGVHKPWPGSRGLARWRPMAVLIPFLHVLGTVLTCFWSRFWSNKLTFWPAASYVQSGQREILLTFTAAKNYLQLRRNVPHLASRQVHFV